jgi:hypothetical protein
MIRNIIILILSTFLLNACDYKPIYSNKSVGDFSIEKISFNGDIEINNLIDKKLKKYRKQDASKKFEADITSSYTKTSQSKDASGKTTDYKIIIKVIFEIDANGEITMFQLQEDFLIKNLTNEFEENKYEKTKIENAINIIINTFTIQLSQI